MRVGVIGTGYAGRKHIEGWLDLGMDVQICARPEDNPAEVGQRHGVEAGTDVDALIASVDVVDVCTPTDVHSPIVLAAAAAGRHVVCEKPIAGSIAEGIKMVAACRDAGVHFYVGHLMRYSPPFATAAKAVADGKVGRPAVVHLSRLTPAPAHSTWMPNVERSGGVIVDLMIHDIDFARWMCGDVTRVVARTAGSQTHHAYAILTHDSGAISQLTASWALPSGSRISFEIAGETGVLEYASDESNPMKIEPPEIAAGIDITPWAEHPVTTQLREFATAISGGPPPRVTADDGLAALRIARAAVESTKTGKAICPEDMS